MRSNSTAKNKLQLVSEAAYNVESLNLYQTIGMRII